MKRTISMALMAIFLFSLTACGGGERSDRLQVVATTTYAGDLVSIIGGDAVDVKTLMGVGVDPHDYQPRQSDTDAIAEADVLVVNGLNLEEKFGQILQNLAGPTLIVLADALEEGDLLYEDENTPDPHIWFDVSLWAKAATHVAETLSSIDPDNAEVYARRLDAYLIELNWLDAYIRARLDELPPERRVLVTAHDAFAYFGRAYDVEVHAVQGISTSAEASIADIQALAELVASLDIPAIFVESSVPERNIRSVKEAAEALGHQIVIGGSLYSDSTGDASRGTETYIRTFRANIDVIVNALSEEE